MGRGIASEKVRFLLKAAQQVGAETGLLEACPPHTMSESVVVLTIRITSPPLTLVSVLLGTRQTPAFGEDW